MDNSHIQSKLWSLFDNLRGDAQSQEVISGLSLLALIAKFNPDGFTQLYTSGGSHQIELLNQLLKQLQDEFPDLPCDKSDLERLPLSTWQALTYYINDCREQLEDLPALFRRALSERGRDRGFYGTTENLQQLFVELVGDASDKVLYDGTAGMAYIASAIKPQQMLLEEINHQVWAISYRLLVLEGLEPSFSNRNSLLESTYDCNADLAIMEPPFGYRINPQDAEWLVESCRPLVDPGKKLPASAGDVLWIQEALGHIHSNGKVVMLLPQGWLFRGGYDAKVRDYLLDEDLIEAVIGLPAGILSFSRIPTMILILNKAKPVGQPIHFVDASLWGHKLRRRHLLSPEEITLIASLAQGIKPEHECYSAVYIPDIRKKGKNGMGGNSLNIAEYFSRPQHLELPDVDTELDKLKSAQQEFEQAQVRLNTLLQQTEGNNTRV